MGHEPERGKPVEHLSVERRAPPAGHEHLDALKPIKSDKSGQVAHGGVGNQVDDTTQAAPRRRIEELILQAGIHDK